MVRALVTGGAGFLGSHLCRRLLSDGFDVLCLDNLLTGSERNLADLLDHPGFQYLEGDITQPLTIDGPLDHVLHLASPASPKDYMRYSIHTLKVGAIGTYHALGLAKAKNASFLLASSSEVYGDPTVNPQPETYWGNVNPIGPRSVYDEAKRYAEALAMAYHYTHGLDVRVARIFNTYGPQMRTEDGRALPNFVMQAIKGEPLTVYGDGTQTRSFCYVDDLIEGLVRLLLWSPAHTTAETEGQATGRVFNIGNPNEVTILQLAQEIIEATESSSKIEHCPLPENDPQVRRPDISKARSFLQWEPRTPRNEGIRQVVSYFREVLQNDTHKSTTTNE